MMDSSLLFSAGNAIVGTAGLLALFGFNTHRRIQDIKAEAISSAKRKKSIERWNRVPGTIIKSNIGHPFYDPDIRPKGFSEATKNRKALRLFLEKEIIKAEEHKASSSGSSLSVLYEYSVSGKEFCGGAVAPGLCQEDDALAYKLKPGQKISLYVNPKDPADAYIWAVSPRYFDSVRKRLNIALAQFYVGGSIVTIASAFAYFNLVK